MTTPLQKILDSKVAFRREVARRPIAEKLRMLEAMRERTVAINLLVDNRPEGRIERIENACADTLV